MSKVKIGVIGVGSMGKNHVRSYAALKHLCDLKGVFDLDGERNIGIAESYGVEAYNSVDDLMSEVDAVNIATPTTTHFKLAMKAIDKGLHILIEKPITNSVEELRLF